MWTDWLVKNRKKILISLMVYSIIIRLFFVFTMPEDMKVLKSDDKTYDHLAVSILTKHEFSKDGTPIAWRVPGYPMLLAGIYALFGHNHLAVRIIQSIMMSLLVVFIYLISKSTFGRKTAIITAILAAFYQPFIFYLYWAGGAFFMTENIFTFYLAVSVWLLIRMRKTGKPKYLVLSGLMLGVSCLTRPVLALLPGYLMIWLWFSYRSFKEAFKKVVIITFFMGIVILPWAIRNYVVFNEFIPLTNEAGDIFLGGNNPEAKGGWAPIISRLEKDPDHMKKYSVTYIKRDKYKEAMEYLKANPGRIPYLAIKKVMVEWNVFNEFGGYNIWYALAAFFGLFGIVYCFTGFKDNTVYPLYLLLFIYVTMIAVIFFGAPRYRFPIEPYLIVLAGYGVHKLVEHKKFKAISAIVIFNLAVYLFSENIIYVIRNVIP